MSEQEGNHRLSWIRAIAAYDRITVTVISNDQLLEEFSLEVRQNDSL